MKELSAPKRLRDAQDSHEEFSGKVDYDTVRVRNRVGTEVVFMIDPHTAVDEIVERVKAHDHALDFLELKSILPLTVYTPGEHHGSGTPGDIPRSVDFSDSEIPRLFGVEAGEFRRMETWARKALYTSFARRLRVVPNRGQA